LAAVRVLVGAYALVYLVARTPHLVDLAGLPRHRWQPVGLLVNLVSPPSGAAAALVLGSTAAAGVAFVAGWCWRLAGPAFALGTLVTTTYGASFGHILHTENLLVLHLLVLAVTPAADAWSMDARHVGERPLRRRRRRPGASPAGAHPPRGAAPGTFTASVRAPAGRYGFPLRLLALVTVLTYAIAGWAKLRNGGDAWLSGNGLRNQVAFDNLRKVLLGDPWSPLGARLVGVGWLWPPLGWATLAVELGAPLALLHRRGRAVWAGAAWAFHLGTLALMAIFFPYPLSGVAFAPMFPVERAVRRLSAMLPRRGSTGPDGRRRGHRDRPAWPPLPTATPGPVRRGADGVDG
jgi:hypothetical protein